jgi:LPXTG-motif cell wall-anchored protein
MVPAYTSRIGLVSNKRRIPGLVAGLLTLVLLLCGTASGHQGDPNYRSEITSIRPSGQAEGLVLAVRNFDDHLELVNGTGEVVLVEGYDGEPYIRFSPSGLVEVNRRSPAFYLNEDRLGEVTVPDTADSKAAPEWKQVATEGRYTWHDHRSHWMGTDAPPQVEDESEPTKVFDYVVPMTVAGVPVDAAGTLTWVGTDGSVPVAPFAALAFIALAGGAGLVLRRRREHTPSGGS